MLQVNSAWSQIWTVKEVEHELSGFEFKGPGWYLSKDESLLVVPFERPNLGPGELWDHSSDNGERFHFYYYGEFSGTIFADGFVPTRQDDRLL